MPVLLRYVFLPLPRPLSFFLASDLSLSLSLSLPPLSPPAAAQLSAACALASLIAPFAPHFAAEAWSEDGPLGKARATAAAAVANEAGAAPFCFSPSSSSQHNNNNNDDIHSLPWPDADLVIAAATAAGLDDLSMYAADPLKVVVQIGGKRRGEIEVDVSALDASAETETGGDDDDGDEKRRAMEGAIGVAVRESEAFERFVSGKGLQLRKLVIVWPKGKGKGKKAKAQKQGGHIICNVVVGK